MDGDAHSKAEGPVSRRRYLRERKAREEAERLLDGKSRELFEANEALKRQAASLEEQVRHRTADLNRAKTVAERANDAKTAFLAMISHEIRTPLNGILGMAEALNDSGLENMQKDMLEVMTGSGQALLSIVNDILDLTKIEAEQLELEAIEFDLTELLDSVSCLYGHQAEAKGLTFTRDYAFDRATRVASDPTRLRQVVSNLVSNALKFTLTGTVVLSAEIVQRRAGRQLVITVTDTGTGVDDDKVHLLFKPFSQTDASITRRHGGTGLGLWISRKICQLMGGDLVFRPNTGGGSVFTARFDVALCDGSDTVQQARRLDADAVLFARPWSILAAEDNRTNRLVLHHMLKRYPLQMTMVENGAEALDAYQRGAFDLVLMDVNMPVMGGLEAAAAIREHEAAQGLRPCPIVALTANAMTHQVEDYLRRGIDSHVAKPVKREVLAGAMARWLVARLN